MAFLHSLPALHSFEINDSNVAEKWSEWKEMWGHYSVASKVNKEEGDVQVAALLTAIGPEARTVFKTWNLSATERKDIKGVIEHNYCNPRKNIPFERYLFNSRQWRKYPSDRNSENPSLERIFHLSVVVSSHGKQALSSYIGQVSLRRDGCC